MGGRRQSVAGGLAAVVGALCGAAVPDDVLRDAVLDDRGALLGHALEIERLGHALGVETVVDQREAVVEELLPVPASISVAPRVLAAFSAASRAQPAGSRSAAFQDVASA